MRRLNRYSHKSSIIHITITNTKTTICRNIRYFASQQDKQNQHPSNYAQFKHQQVTNETQNNIGNESPTMGRKPRTSDQNVLKTLYNGKNEIVLSLLKTHFVRIFSSNDNPSCSLFALSSSNQYSNAVPLSHHLLQLFSSEKINIHILNNHQLVDKNILKEYKNTINITSNINAFESFNKGHDIVLNNPFYVDFVLNYAGFLPQKK
eukprot:300903_1